MQCVQQEITPGMSKFHHGGIQCSSETITLFALVLQELPSWSGINSQTNDSNAYQTAGCREKDGRFRRKSE